MWAKKTIEEFLKECGITINGNKPYDVVVHNEGLYNRVLRHGTLGLGESYIDGWWDCDQLDEFFNRVIKSSGERKIKNNFKVFTRVAWNLFFSVNGKRAFEVGEKHYDVGNDLYRAMLDKRLVYTCGYWNSANNLDESQEAKLDLICKKIGLKKGQSVLDIGSGWGSFIKYAAEKYEANAFGITVSKEQKHLADKLNKGLSAYTKLQDYRSVSGEFDHVVSVGMFEHVGHRNYRKFMEVAHRSLRDDGLFLLHTIGGNHSTTVGDPWIEKYIFPNGMLPSIKQISKAAEGLFVIEDVHNFGADYDRTLMEWYKNFNNNWDSIKENYDDRFYRMWKYYLLMSAGSFRARKNQLWQIVLSKRGVPDGYKSVR